MKKIEKNPSEPHTLFRKLFEKIVFILWGWVEEYKLFLT